MSTYRASWRLSTRPLAVAVGLALLAPTAGCRLEIGEDAGTDAGGDAGTDAACAFSAPVPVAELNTDDADLHPWLTPDGLEVYFMSNRAGGAGDRDLWHATRPSTAAKFSMPVNLALLNTSSLDGGPTLSEDGLTLYLFSNRPGGLGQNDIWVATRPTTADDFGAPALVTEVSSADDELGPTLAAGGLALYFPSNRPGLGDYDIWVATRTATTDPFGAPVLVPDLSSAAGDRLVTLSADGLTAFVPTDRASTFDYDIWLFTRTSATGLFEAVGPVTELNSPADDRARWLSPDGLTLYMSSTRAIPGGPADWNIFVATRPCL